jgi:RND superfamily putative drug exporter
MERITRFVLAHRRAVAMAWVLLALAGGATASLTTSRLGKTFTLPGSASARADSAVVARYGVGGGTDPVIAVVTTPRGTLTSASGTRLLGQLAVAASLRGRNRVVGWPGTRDRRFVSSDGRTSFLLVFTPPAGFGTPDPTPAVGAALRAALPPGSSVSLTGSAALQAGGGTGSGNGVLAESVLGGAGALVILAVVFASALAVLPLLIALVAIPTTFLLLLALTEVTTVNFVVQFLVGLIGLGVAIDYSLLVTTRWREETARRGREEAVVAAMATAGRSVVFSGTTVAIGLLSLIVLPVPFLHSMGIGGVLVPLVSVAAAITLLPVCLAGFGPALDRHRLRGLDSASRPWMWWARTVNRHRVAAAVLGAAVVVALLLPLARISVGQPLSTSLSAAGPAQAALRTLSAGGVPRGVLDPMEVVVRSPGGPPRGADALAARLSRIPGVWTATGPVGRDDARDGTALVTVLPVAESGAPGGIATVERLRRAVAGDPSVLGVSGSGPDTLDFDQAIYGHFPLLLVLVSLLTLLVLVRAFRSLLLAVKAVLLNLASLGCAYGVLVLVWQDGYGSRLLFGLPPTGTIVNWVPIVVFAFLFGLAIDYEVFILTRMREAWDERGDTAVAVTEGIGRTGRLVTSAALILTFAFVSMATAPLTFLKVLATGLAAGILVDAFVVRCLLVPALVSLLGRLNWWLPSFLARAMRVAPLRVADRAAHADA